ncbi:MAG TPA: sigma-70 family RNA polymerase sigma factor [Gemmataceae bacterium]|jgi:RNA polymerase sigma-70 factor (ECF subfamily)|nr:sigma-70 family RNA polymerase sigma factor [Gemmataceae bacterium]
MTQPGASPTLEGPAASAAAPPSAGDRLTSVFHEMRDELVSTLLYLLGNRDDAQDAAQEAFVKCWRSRDSIPDVHNLRAWIFRVGLNAAKDMQRSAWNRKAKAFAGDETAIVGRDLVPGQALEDQEDLARLRAAILDLRPDEKEVFLLRQNGGLTYEEIAVIRSAPVGTVKTQMRTALMKLRKVLA